MKNIQEESTWHGAVTFLECSSLTEPMEADALVIGGGLTSIKTTFSEHQETVNDISDEQVGSYV